jgi:hypothetical protein
MNAIGMVITYVLERNEDLSCARSSPPSAAMVLKNPTDADRSLVIMKSSPVAVRFDADLFVHVSHRGRSRFSSSLYIILSLCSVHCHQSNNFRLFDCCNDLLQRCISIASSHSFWQRQQALNSLRLRFLFRIRLPILPLSLPLPPLPPQSRRPQRSVARHLIGIYLLRI